MQHHSRIYILMSLVFAAFTGLFMSCSQNLPEVASTDYSVIFDYSDETSAPSARLSVFASSNSDVRRYQRIRIKSVETGWEWDTQVISKLESDNTQWAGCTNLVAPENEKLPVGTYEITYFNADEKEYSLTIDVKYDLQFYDVLLPALPEVMAAKRGSSKGSKTIEKIAIYDKEHILIYFGDRTEEFMTTRDIWNQYRDAATYQIIWYADRGTVICVTPEKQVTPE